MLSDARIRTEPGGARAPQPAFRFPLPLFTALLPR